MSGYKHSDFRIEQERARRLELVQQITAAQGEIESLKERITGLLASASPGLKASFGAEVQQAQQWLLQTATTSQKEPDIQSSARVLESQLSNLQSIAQHGQTVLKALVIAFTQKAGERARTCAERLAQCESLYLTKRKLLELWFKQPSISQLDATLKQARTLLEKDNYRQLEEILTYFEKEISEKSQLAEQQEDRHQKRLYLLKALRQVCKEMGFEEVYPPRYEREGERGSRILFMVDTINRGKIEFAISLDGIRSNSEIDPGHCFEDFDQISDYLNNEFGIQTKFELESGEPRPKLKQRGEKDLPYGRGKEAQA